MLLRWVNLPSLMYNRHLIGDRRTVSKILPLVAIKHIANSTAIDAAKSPR